MLRNVDKNDENNYINIVFTPNGDEFGTPAIYSQTFSETILKNPSDYYCSVIRFQIPLDQVPLFHFPVDIFQNNPLMSDLVIGIKKADLTLYPQNVLYIPDFAPSPLLPVPVPAASSPYFTNEQSISQYYAVYSINKFLLMLNTTIQSAVTAAALGVTAPYYIYNPVTQLISLIVTQTFIATGAEIFLNTDAINYVHTFQWFYNPSPTVGDRFFHVLNPLPYGSPVGGPYVYSEEYTAMSLWLSVRRIIITSNSLPVKPEAIPNQNSNDGNLSFEPILTDFILPIDNVNGLSTVAIYSPQGQYRLINMTGNTPINKIDLSISYYDKYGNIFPIIISNTQTASVKLGFFLKNLYLNTNTNKYA